MMRKSQSHIEKMENIESRMQVYIEKTEARMQRTENAWEELFEISQKRKDLEEREREIANSLHDPEMSATDMMKFLSADGIRTDFIDRENNYDYIPDTITCIPSPGPIKTYLEKGLELKDTSKYMEKALQLENADINKEEAIDIINEISQLSPEQLKLLREGLNEKSNLSFLYIMGMLFIYLSIVPNQLIELVSEMHLIATDIVYITNNYISLVPQYVFRFLLLLSPLIFIFYLSYFIYARDENNEQNRKQNKKEKRKKKDEYYY